MSASTAKFERILDLEFQVRADSAVAACRTTGVSDYRASQQDSSLAASRAKLAAAIDALTFAEMVEFGAYRQAAMN